MKAITILLMLASVCMAQELPDAPMPQTTPEKPPVYFTFMDRNAVKPLRTNRQTLASPGFYVPQVLAYTAIAVDIDRTRHSANAPRGADLYVDALLPAVVISAMSYGADRLLWRPLGTGLMGFVIFKHSRAAVTGRYP
jgi:hypothetical protein